MNDFQKIGLNFNYIYKLAKGSWIAGWSLPQTVMSLIDSTFSRYPIDYLTSCA